MTRLDIPYEADRTSRQPRWVLHCDMDAFFTSVEQLTRPTLRDRPVLVGGRFERGVVAGASYEARALGCHSAMPMHQAIRLIEPRGVVVPPRGVVYRAVSTRIFDLLRGVIPVIEQVSVDEAFLEPAELAHCSVAEVHDYCEQLRSMVKQDTGLSVSFGAGSGKQYAKIASGLAKPDGVRIIPASAKDRLLRPLAVRQLWGIGPVFEAKLHKEGIVTIGDFADLSERDAGILLGKKVGHELLQIAQGFDNRPVQERAIAKQISSEETYPDNLVRREDILAAIDSNADDAYRRLLSDGRAARTVTVKVKLADMTILSRSATLPYATTDLRTLLAVAYRMAVDSEVVGACRLVGVSLSGLSHVRQEPLFPELDWDVDIEEDVRRSFGNTSSDVEHSGESVPATGGGDAGVSPSRAPGTVVPQWRTGMDVTHPEYGLGWVQGAGQGKVTVRFETRTSGPGRAITFAEEEALLAPANSLLSLDWPEQMLHSEAGTEKAGG